MPAAPTHPFHQRAESLLSELESTGQMKQLQMIEGPMGPTITLRGRGEVLCFCSNNYLGLANHPEVVEAGIKGIRDYGAGTASVRFICGTFTPHEILEERIAEFMGTEASYSFVSCWNANEAIFPTLCEPGDLILSDELNHASIIDGVRLAASIKKGLHKGVYGHNDLGSLREKLEAARANPDVTGVIWVVTDGVFSMEGDIADLPGLRKLCDEFDALLVVDDSHGPASWARPAGARPRAPGPLAGREIDFFTGTLGKALGGAAGGFIAGPKDGVDLIVQRARPTLFSTPCPSASRARHQGHRDCHARARARAAARDNVAYARTKIRDAGFEVLDSPTAICPIIVGDTAEAIAMSQRLLELGVFVIGFGYPVVPEGEARLRVQISAAHEQEHLDGLLDALKKL